MDNQSDDQDHIPEEELTDVDSLSEALRLLSMTEIVYTLNWRWAEFQLYVISPVIQLISPPLIIPPAPLEGGGGFEFVYPIHDYGFKIATSKAEDMVSSGMSMCKLYFTIEKIIYLFVERLKSGGVDPSMEVQVAFDGFVLAQRKAFESVINLNYNVVITNFDPGEWGNRFINNIKLLADKGYGYPGESPRTSFRTAVVSTPKI